MKRSKQEYEAANNFNKDTSSEVVVQATSVFYKNQQCKKPIVVNRGGASSSKSHSIAQLILHKFFTEEKKQILILRKSLPSLRISAYKLMKDLAVEYGLWQDIVEEKVHMNWYYNGAMIHFGSVDDPEKLKSTEFHYMWIEEATDISYDDFQVINLRLRAKSLDGKKNQMFLSFNPIDEFHWIKTKLLDDPSMKEDVEEIVSTYKDNPFTDNDYQKKLEKLIEQDINYYNVYALGNWGKLENVIYSNWDIVDWMPDVSNVESVFYGLDFGYNDPCALAEYRKKGKEIWEKELLYHFKLTNSDLIIKMQEVIPPEKRRFMVYADADEPDRIIEIRRAGFRIKPGIKLIQNGIDTVKRYQIHIFNESANAVKESRAYAWRKDKNDNVTDEPIDYMNHIMDARRYAVHTHLRGSDGKFRVRWV